MMIRFDRLKSAPPSRTRRPLHPASRSGPHAARPTRVSRPSCSLIHQPVSTVWSRSHKD
ncbi:hypothetical protein B0H12DRAFT_1139800 [Mycena haematopus]|nr:hypothetical protein B0H12DRAFT_1139800 [Mycena haematopus]